MVSLAGLSEGLFNGVCVKRTKRWKTEAVNHYICMSHRVFPLSYEGFEFSKAVVESRRSSSSRKRGGSCASSRSGYGLYGSACRIKTREDELLQQYVCK